MQAHIFVQEIEAINESAVQDSLICLSAISQASPKGRSVILEGAGLAAVRSALEISPPCQIWAVRLLLSLSETTVEGGADFDGKPPQPPRNLPSGRETLHTHF